MKSYSDLSLSDFLETRTSSPMAWLVWGGVFQGVFWCSALIGISVPLATAIAFVVARLAFVYLALPKGARLDSFIQHLGGLTAGYLAFRGVLGSSFWIGVTATIGAFYLGSWTTQFVWSRIALRFAMDPARCLDRSVHVAEAELCDDRYDLGELLEPLRARYKVPALAAAFADCDGISAGGATGARVAGEARAVTSLDRFHFGSITKSMTATLSAILVDEGHLTWEATLAEVSPRLAENVHAGFHSVTLRQYLGHRSGVSSDWTDRGRIAALYQLGGTPIEQRVAYVANKLSRHPRHKSGKQFMYSNVNYAIAGLMVETTVGTSWEMLMKERLFAPLGLERAGIGAPGCREHLDEPWGHAHGRFPIPPGRRADLPPAIAPGASAHGSIVDLARFGQLHLRAALARNGLRPNADVIRDLHVPGGNEAALGLRSTRYGLGWFVVSRPWTNGLAFMHSGSIGSWVAYLWVVPGQNAVIATAANSGQWSGAIAADQAAIALIGKYIDKRFAHTSRLAGITD